jgi:hypothetical protein
VLRMPTGPLGWVTLWVAVVAVTSSIAWLAIGVAGREVTTLTRTASATGTPSAPATSAPSGSLPSGTPAESTDDSESRSTPPSTGTPSPDHDTSVAAISSIQVRGGSVGARCASGAARIVWIKPQVGWSFERHNDDGQLEVYFRSSSGDRVEVKVRCAGGRPVFEQE